MEGEGRARGKLKRQEFKENLSRDSERCFERYKEKLKNYIACGKTLKKIIQRFYIRVYDIFRMFINYKHLK